MNKIILLVLFAGAADAQTTWDYTDANSAFDGSVTIAAALAANGTQTVSLTSFAFNELPNIASPNGITMGGGLQNAGDGLLQITFTTVNNAVTAWNASWYFGTPGTNTPTGEQVTLSNSGDTFLMQTGGVGCMPPYPGAASPCYPISFTGSGGAWSTSPTCAPEMSQDAAALTLLVGGLLVLRGRRISRAPHKSQLAAGAPA
jgi:hypothetical protein